jgi:dipeptidyl aminopeptidase/acylaminoacyl peptidase
VRAFLERIAPLRQADKIKSPLLIVQGQNDPRVKVSEAVAMRDAVRRHGTPVWYLLGKNEGHGFSEMDNYLYQSYVTVLFTEEFLLK